MADKKIQMSQRNATNDGWDNLYPKTTGEQVVAADGTTTFESHLADKVNHVPYGVATGSANTYAVTLTPAPAAYADGMALSVKINVDANAASTINVNGLGVKSIKKANGTDVTNLKANGVYTLRYNSTTGNFILQGEGASGNATASDLYSGKTASADAGDIVGTNPYKSGVMVSSDKLGFRSPIAKMMTFNSTYGIAVYIDQGSKYYYYVDTSGNLYRYAFTQEGTISKSLETHMAWPDMFWMNVINNKYVVMAYNNNNGSIKIRSFNCSDLTENGSAIIPAGVAWVAFKDNYIFVNTNNTVIKKYTVNPDTGVITETASVTMSASVGRFTIFKNELYFVVSNTIKVYDLNLNFVRNEAAISNLSYAYPLDNYYLGYTGTLTLFNRPSGTTVAGISTDYYPDIWQFEETIIGLWTKLSTYGIYALDVDAAAKYYSQFIAVVAGTTMRFLSMNGAQATIDADTSTYHFVYTVFLGMKLI